MCKTARTIWSNAPATWAEMKTRSEPALSRAAAIGPAIIEDKHAGSRRHETSDRACRRDTAVRVFRASRARSYCEATPRGRARTLHDLRIVAIRRLLSKRKRRAGCN